MILTAKKILLGTITFFLPPTTRTKVIRLGVLIIALVSIVVLINKNSEIAEETGALPPIVFVGTVSDLDTDTGSSFVGTVRAVSEAQIQSEIGGRITSVNVKPSDKVSAGAILASLENSSQRAALLQAQGAYEATLATTEQSNISANDAQNTLLAAQNNVVTTYRNAYTTVNSIVISTVDTFFSNPNAQSTPGVMVDTSINNTIFLNKTRVALQKILTDWQNSSNSLTSTSDLEAHLLEAEATIKTVVSLVDILITASNNAALSDTIDGQLTTSYTSSLTTARATLDSTLSAISNARTGLSSARENLRRAQIGSTQNAEVSLAGAQIKQALGSLRSAQANYEKTIFRSPISGTVNSVRIHVGDFIPAFTQVAEVANNTALQISIYAGESDLPRFTVGGTVKIGKSATGIITTIAPAIDSLTQKTEIKIATESTELTNGATVTVTLDQAKDLFVEGTPLYIPITAVKFSATDGVVFTVSEEKLVANPVQIGAISGSFVNITEGMDRDTIFVLDARGLSEGQHVESTRK
ncbi:MAG: HlyD family efflux transporter periplasmic adaptor subunit [Candidatus Pacebacteria bacterium]|nr:HlyD family efflux transporter periplasmic adaptor subunit [Candidatus Paceibacterota bacterium]MCF7857184.1 HlyD family efflux transporter periplasmic adaptor subunit [Candidatus Paceibacterota bacterium]